MEMDKNGLKLMEMAKIVKLAEIVKIAKMAKNGQKQPKLVENGWNWIDMDGFG